MTTLVHGTTRHRAESIISNGPDPRYLEPGGVPSNDGFSTYVEGGPYLYRPPGSRYRGSGPLLMIDSARCRVVPWTSVVMVGQVVPLLASRSHTVNNITNELPDHSARFHALHRDGTDDLLCGPGVGGRQDRRRRHRPAL